MAQELDRRIANPHLDVREVPLRHIGRACESLACQAAAGPQRARTLAQRREKGILTFDLKQLFFGHGPALR